LHCNGFHPSSCRTRSGGSGCPPPRPRRWRPRSRSADNSGSTVNGPPDTW